MKHKLGIENLPNGASCGTCSCGWVSRTYEGQSKNLDNLRQEFEGHLPIGSDDYLACLLSRQMEADHSRKYNLLSEAEKQKLASTPHTTHKPMKHKVILSPVANGAGRGVCSCGWTSRVYDDGDMFHVNLSAELDQEIRKHLASEPMTHERLTEMGVPSLMHLLTQLRGDYDWWNAEIAENLRLRLNASKLEE